MGGAEDSIIIPTYSSDIPCVISKSCNSYHTTDSQNISEANLPCDAIPCEKPIKLNSYHTIDSQSIPEAPISCNDNTVYDSSTPSFLNSSLDNLGRTSEHVDKAYEYETPGLLQDLKIKVKINRDPPPLTKEAWEEINAEFENINQASWDNFRTKNTEPEDYITNLNKTLASFLESKPEFQREVKTFF